MKFWFASRVAAKSAAKIVAARSPVDLALIGAGVTTAASSALFAVAMFAQGDHPPMVNGMQYLGVFGQPHRTVVASTAAPPVFVPGATGSPVKAQAPAAQPIRVVVAASSTPARETVDLTPTGSIAHGAGEATPEVDPYRLVAVEPGLAWLRNSAETRVIKPGDFAPGLGHIAAIVIRDGHWTLVDDSGAALLVADAPAADPFARRMIFGGQ